jgi:excisionase family DNA binding protein
MSPTRANHTEFSGLVDIERTKPATLTVDEAHALIGTNKISRGGFYAAINRHEVPHLRLGHRILIPRHAFMRWLETAGQTETRA